MQALSTRREPGSATRIQLTPMREQQRPDRLSTVSGHRLLNNPIGRQLPIAGNKEQVEPQPRDELPLARPAH